MSAQPEIAAAAPAPMDESLRPEHLPRLDPAAAEAINAFLRARPGGEFSVQQGDLEFSWRADPPATLALVMDFACGAQRVALALDSLAALDPLLVGAPFNSLPPPLRDLVIDHRVAAFLDALPAAIATGVELQGIRWDVQEQPRWAIALPFVLRRRPQGPASHGVIGCESAATLQWLHAELPRTQLADHATQSALRAVLTIALGASAIAAAQLRQLASADVVWIESAVVERRGVRVQVHAGRSTRVWPALLKRTCVCVTGPAQRQPDDALSARQMPADRTESSRWAAIGGTFMSAVPAELEVPVEFDLGALQVPVGELERLQPGMTFNLNVDAAHATVNLRVAGRCIAQGTLVVVGRRLGVRIGQVLLNRQSQG